ncbi:unnamed protein product [Nezara viridula]|uniref:Uncharacterized protein n=1 Tax=Nezara viridula TaxID=85310 RepID=A0A9P0H920_NEZVI|nr:unnamed protein product [Nezara viridula]
MQASFGVRHHIILRPSLQYSRTLISPEEIVLEALLIYYSRWVNPEESDHLDGGALRGGHDAPRVGEAIEVESVPSDPRFNTHHVVYRKVFQETFLHFPTTFDISLEAGHEGISTFFLVNGMLHSSFMFFAWWCNALPNVSRLTAMLRDLKAIDTLLNGYFTDFDKCMSFKSTCFIAMYVLVVGVMDQLSSDYEDFEPTSRRTDASQAPSIEDCRQTDQDLQAAVGLRYDGKRYLFSPTSEILNRQVDGLMHLKLPPLRAVVRLTKTCRRLSDCARTANGIYSLQLLNTASEQLLDPSQMIGHGVWYLGCAKSVCSLDHSYNIRRPSCSLCGGLFLPAIEPTADVVHRPKSCIINLL